MTLALLCSGQGHQDAAMFDLVADCEAAGPLFRAAADLLNGQDPRDLVRTASHDDLTRNRTAQILCVLQALALRAALADVLPDRRCVAGYSVGEVAAWSLADALEPLTALRLVAARAEAMDAASGPDDGLVFVRGLPQVRVAFLCEQAGTAISIINPSDAFVVGGTRSALARFVDAARPAGAQRVVPIDVHVASHTAKLNAATIRFSKDMGTANIAELRNGVRLFRGIDGSAVADIRSGLEGLARQISEPVNWSACLQACVEAGAEVFLETGPGDALAKMATELQPGARARNAAEFKTIAGLSAWLTAVLSSRLRLARQPV